jgi:hypothetical protein
MDWIELAQDRDPWRVLMSTVLNLRISIAFWEILELLLNWRALSKGSAPRSQMSVSLTTYFLAFLGMPTICIGLLLTVCAI